MSKFSVQCSVFRQIEIEIGIATGIDYDYDNE